MAKPKSQPARKTTARNSKADATPRRALLVLGMHRSGTSALSGLLQNLGCGGPKTPMQANDRNRKGHFESLPLSELHDEMLDSAETLWEDYRPFPQAWYDTAKAEEFRLRLKEMIQAEFGGSPLFVVKDPRICRFLTFWINALQDMDIQPLVVHTHRNPLEVAASLRERDGFDPRFGCLLWLRHILDAEASSRELPRVFTSYTALLKDWKSVAMRIQNSLSVEWPNATSESESYLTSFISTDLQNQNVADHTVLQHPQISPWVRDSYAILERLASGTEEAKDAARLDDIRTAFDISCIAFSSLAQPRGETQSAKSSGARAELIECRAQLREHQRAVGDLTKKLERSDAALSLSKQQLNRQMKANDGLTKVHKQEKETLQTEISDLQKALDKQSAELEDYREELTALSKTTAIKQQELEQLLQQHEEDAKRLGQELANMSDLFLSEKQNKNLVVAQLQAAQASLSANEASLASSKAAWVKMKARNNHLELERQALLNSTSWRMTQPLRWLKTRFGSKHPRGS